MEKTFDLMVIGHIAMDTVIKRINKHDRVKKLSAGGAVTFSSLAVKTANPAMNVGIATKVGRDFKRDLLSPYNDLGVNLENIVIDESCSSTRFELTYEGEKRTLSCPAKCSALEFSEFNSNFCNSRRFHLGPLCREINTKFITEMGNYLQDNQVVGTDLQGFIRKINKNGSIEFIDSTQGKRTVDLLYEIFNGRLFIKADDAEAFAISKVRGMTENVEYFLDRYPKATVIITSGRHGSVLGKVDNKRRIEKIPAFKPSKIIDETGAGDTFLGTLLSLIPVKEEFSFSKLREAAYLASAQSSFLVQEKGFKGTRKIEDVKLRVQNQNYFN